MLAGRLCVFILVVVCSLCSACSGPANAPAFGCAALFIGSQEGGGRASASAAADLQAIGCRGQGREADRPLGMSNSIWTGLYLKGGAAEEQIAHFQDPNMVYKHAVEVGQDIAELRRSIASVFSRTGQTDGSSPVEGGGGGREGAVGTCKGEGHRVYGEETGGSDSYYLVTPSVLQVCWG